MPFSDVTVGGACMLEIEGNRLDLKWITSTGEIKDQFTMMKDVNKKVEINAKQGEAVILKASFIGNYKWSGTNKTTQSIEVKPSLGVTKYTVIDPQNCLQDEFEVNVVKK